MQWPATARLDCRVFVLAIVSCVTPVGCCLSCLSCLSAMADALAPPNADESATAVGPASLPPAAAPVVVDSTLRVYRFTATAATSGHPFNCQITFLKDSYLVWVGNPLEPPALPNLVRASVRECASVLACSLADDGATNKGRGRKVGGGEVEAEASRLRSSPATLPFQSGAPLVVLLLAHSPLPAQKRVARFTCSPALSLPPPPHIFPERLHPHAVFPHSLHRRGPEPHGRDERHRGPIQREARDGAQGARVRHLRPAGLAPTRGRGPPTSHTTDSRGELSSSSNNGDDGRSGGGRSDGSNSRSSGSIRNE